MDELVISLGLRVALCLYYSTFEGVICCFPSGVQVDEPSPPVTPVFHQTQIPDDSRQKSCAQAAGSSSSRGK